MDLEEFELLVLVTVDVPVISISACLNNVLHLALTSSDPKLGKLSIYLLVAPIH